MGAATTRSAARAATLAALPVALLVGAIVFWALGGFDGLRADDPPRSPEPVPSGPVMMAAVPLTEPAVTVCRTFIEALPTAVRDRPRRDVTAGPAQNAAYGQPPLTVACGLPIPSYAADTILAVVSGVCWYVEDERWTTVDRTVPVTVNVPRSYGPGGQWVVDLAMPIIRTLPVRATVPFGCTG
jgi:hypothetical protein